MPLADQRDAEETRAVLVGWLAHQIPDASGLTVAELTIPQSSGFSNETFLFDARWQENGSARQGEFVLRAQPRAYGLFPHTDVVSQQFDTMRLVGETGGVPVPAVRWAERDASVLGTPFFVMDRIRGDVPGDSPPYVVEGMVMDMNPADRRKLFENGVRAMAGIHQIDVSDGSFEHLNRAAQGHGEPGPAQLQSYFANYTTWVMGDLQSPTLTRAWEWLVANWPDDGDRIDLTWGDARPGNQMFQGTDVVGIFDWEMSALANAESDVGWWIFMQQFHCAAAGVQAPEGFLSPDETVAVWESATGRTAEHMDFYTKLGGYHFCLIMVAMYNSLSKIAPGAVEEDFALNNPGPRVLAEMMGFEH